LSKGPNGSVNKAGVYINSIYGTTILRDMRIYNFADERPNSWSGENGIISSGKCTGTLLMERVELHDNGGGDGPAHNMYIGPGANNSFTLKMVNCWSHNSVYGHLVKSRAQNTELWGCYLQGGVPGQFPTKDPVGDNWLLDCPNGGRLIVRNTIFVKNKSGTSTTSTNGASITHGIEGPDPTRPHSVDVQHCTFVAFSGTYDGNPGHITWPFIFARDAVPVGGQLSYSWAVPAPFPATVARNAFVGYPERVGNASRTYRGDLSVTAAFAELSQDFSLSVKAAPGDDGADDAIVGTPAYAHEAQRGATRETKAVGAVD